MSDDLSNFLLSLVISFIFLIVYLNEPIFALLCLVTFVMYCLLQLGVGK